MEPKDIAAFIVFAPLIAVWICGGLYFCAMLLRLSWDELKGEA